MGRGVEAAGQPTRQTADRPHALGLTQLLLAPFQGSRGGFFCSVDYGASWQRRSSYVSGSPQYYQEIFVDPQDADRIYSMDVRLQVSDDGGGLDLEAIRRKAETLGYLAPAAALDEDAAAELIFRPGFSTKQRGWGLGLSLAKRIIEEYHGGSIQLKETQPEAGSTFRIVFNIKQ